MTRDDHKHSQDWNLVEHHAMDRLHQVEKDQRRPYKKEAHPVHWQQIIMMGLLVVALITMLWTLF